MNLKKNRVRGLWMMLYCGWDGGVMMDLLGGFKGLM